MGLAIVTAMIRITVHIVIATRQQILRATLDLARHVTDNLDDLGLVLAKRLISPDLGRHRPAPDPSRAPPAAPVTRLW